MSVLAGCWTADAETKCRTMLVAQSRFSSGPATMTTAGPVAGGMAFSPLLQEDHLDPIILTNPRGDFLCADVRLDDRIGLAKTLGVDPRHCSDRAIVMCALERWALDALPRIYGDFALAYWNSNRRELTLCRDMGGQKPLFFHHRPGLFAWASMSRGLTCLAEIPASANLSELARFLDLESEAHDRSFFEGLSKVEPGQAITFDGSELRRTRIWTPPATELRLSSDAAYVEGLRERLDAAVAARVRTADGRIGCQLSSGLDSGAVTATAARQMSSRTITAYTSVPTMAVAPSQLGELTDEGPLAAHYAQLHPNLDHRRVVSGATSPLETLARDTELLERPLMNPVNMIWIDRILDEARRDGVAVLLTGARGNMGFSYNGAMLLPLLLKRGAIGAAWREGRAMARRGEPVARIAAGAIGPFLPRPLWHSALRLGGRSARERPSWNGRETRADALQRVDYGNYVKGWFGGWGIEVRDPTADRALVEFCLAVPEEQFLRGGIQRSLARRSIADRVPAQILDCPRRGYQASDWFEGFAGIRDAVAAELDFARADAALSALIDLPRLDSLVANWPSKWDDSALRGPYRLDLMRRLAAIAFVRYARRSPSP